MTKLSVIVSTAALLAAAAPALAQQSTTTVVTKKPSAGAGVGVVGGAIAGAAVGGPVGAVVGAVVGGATGAAVDPPEEVRTYVTTQNVPPIDYNGNVAVGAVLPGDITYYDIPRYERYRWANLNGQRVLIDRRTRKVVAVVEGPPPPEARSYIMSQTIQPVPYDGPIVVGQPLPASVEVFEIPNYSRYRWTFANGRRVMIDARTRNVVAILDK